MYLVLLQELITMHGHLNVENLSCNNFRLKLHVHLNEIRTYEFWYVTQHR